MDLGLHSPQPPPLGAPKSRDTHVVGGSLLPVHGPCDVHPAGHKVDAEDLHRGWSAPTPVMLYRMGMSLSLSDRIWKGGADRGEEGQASYRDLTLIPLDGLMMSLSGHVRPQPALVVHSGDQKGR